jgi:hypothetical protein
MSEQEFEIVPPGKIVLLFPLFIGLVLPIFVLVALILAAKGRNDWLLAAPAELIMPLVAALLAWSMHRRKVRLSDAGLTVHLLPWRSAIKLSDLDLDNARIVNLDEHRELLPVRKIAGTYLPGYRSGLFRTRDRRRATVILTDRRRVLVLPKRDGNLILLSLQRPDALLAALTRRRG